ncbi:hypothetical protein [Methylobacterium sp. sgz302541]|uniref:hypothetical protein n=1 Tax=unclassified Methylobacterium TaxID=2615210 RepID=UPI003D33063A
MKRDKLTDYLLNQIEQIGPIQFRGEEIRFRKQLEALSDSEFRAMWRDELRATAMSIEDNIQFSSPSYDAEFDVWARKPIWTVDEFAILAAGKDPLRVSAQDLEQIAFTSKMGKRFAEARDIAQRLVVLEKLHDPDKPENFVLQARKYGLELTLEMTSPVEETTGKLLGLHEENVFLRAELEKIKSSPEYRDRERQSINQIIVGMIISIYKFDLSKRRDPAIVEMHGDIVRGLSRYDYKISVDTVRKFVSQAIHDLGLESSRKRPSV